MPVNENAYQQQLRQDRARMEDRARQQAASQRRPEPVPFPFSMFCLACLFDLLGLIPIVNLMTELLAGFIINYLWQKNYSPKTDPLLTFIIAKIVDAIFIGFLPSNIAVVLYAYFKKKAAAAVQAPLGQYATGKILKNQQT